MVRGRRLANLLRAPGRRRGGAASAQAGAGWRVAVLSLALGALALSAAQAGPCCRGFALIPPPRDSVEWGKFGFSLNTRETKMVLAKCESGHSWGECTVEPYGPLSLEPAATILNYGQGLFEGVKAFRTEKGRVVLFRPEMNAARMADGARRLLVPPVPTPLFLKACRLAVTENAEWVPPVGDGALYLRPILFGSGPGLGVKPSSEYTFVIFVAPVGQYFGPGSLSRGARMQLCTEHHRAAPLGVGGVKTIGNYAQCFSAQRDARADGFSDVIYVDVSGNYIEEAAAANFFCVDADRTLHTPQLGQILPGVTRDTVMQLAGRFRSEGVHLQVGKVTLETALAAREAFLCGTGAGLTPIGHLSAGDAAVDFDVPGPVTSLLQKALDDIQQERAEDEHGWLYDPYAAAPRTQGGVVEPAL